MNRWPNFRPLPKRRCKRCDQGYGSTYHQTVCRNAYPPKLVGELRARRRRINRKKYGVDSVR